MRRVGANLEDVFLKLTTEESPDTLAASPAESEAESSAAAPSPESALPSEGDAL
jgi:hypothetical protein